MNKAWEYIISKQLTNEQVQSMKEKGVAFVKGWTAHENQLDASFDIYKNRIIIVKVNENIYSASGCSIDKLTRFIKELESKFSIELLNRLLVAYKKNDTIEVVHSSKIKDLLNSGDINENTIIYNTSAATETELNNWEQPLKNTWLSKYL